MVEKCPSVRRGECAVGIALEVHGGSAQRSNDTAVYVTVRQQSDADGRIVTALQRWTLINRFAIRAGVAQSVERILGKDKVTGSIPVTSSIHTAA